MNYLILEDEINAYEYLKGLIEKLRPDARCLAHLDSVEEGINWMHSATVQPDLIFMDIQLSDGISFEIFKHVEVHSPVIFTTAYDQFAVNAFKVNGLDYLLKPITEEDMQQALVRYDQLRNQSIQKNSVQKIADTFSDAKKNRFLVKKGNHFEFIRSDDIAFVHSEDSMTFLFTHEGKRHIYSKTLNEIVGGLDDQLFFQINRGQIIHINAIKKIHPYLNQRLKLELNVPTEIEFIVSRNKMMDFKNWVDS